MHKTIVCHCGPDLSQLPCLAHTQEEAEHLATAHSGRAMDVLVPFDEISLEWEELKHTLQRCEDSLTVASRLQSFIQVK